MNDAADAFERELEAVSYTSGEIPLYSDMTARPYTQDVPHLLSRQICNPVQWEALIRNMIADGIDTFVEIGPGKTLTNMMKKIDPAVKAYTVKEYLSEAKPC